MVGAKYKSARLLFRLLLTFPCGKVAFDYVEPVLLYYRGIISRLPGNHTPKKAPIPFINLLVPIRASAFMYNKHNPALRKLSGVGKLTPGNFCLAATSMFCILSTIHGLYHPTKRN
jgi:hypothetical protein